MKVVYRAVVERPKLRIGSEGDGERVSYVISCVQPLLIVGLFVSITSQKMLYIVTLPQHLLI